MVELSLARVDLRRGVSFLGDVDDIDGLFRLWTHTQFLKGFQEAFFFVKSFVEELHSRHGQLDQGNLVCRSKKVVGFVIKQLCETIRLGHKVLQVSRLSWLIRGFWGER